MADGAMAKRILLVDDEFDLRMIYTAVLDPLGEILTASDGQEALTLAQRLPPDLIVTDYNMPVMDGAELIRRLHAEGARIPIIMLSAHFSEAVCELREEMLRLGVVCLSKQVDNNLLRGIASGLLNAI